MSAERALSPHEVSQKIVALVHRLGCELVGFAPPERPQRADYFSKWLASGKAGTMTYLNRSEMKRLQPDRVLAGARTLIVVAQSYFSGRLPEEIRKDPSRGIIASYAWGYDYHDVLQRKLDLISHEIRMLVPGSRTVFYVDTGPVMERDHAERAGLGFIGKNTLLISPAIGSKVFLGVILTTVELPPSMARNFPTCGSCTRCLDACPTGALTAPYEMEATRCIAYLTIELKGSIPGPLRRQLGNRIFGCDDCQDCCPWNVRFSRPTQESAYRGTLPRQAPLLNELAHLSPTQFRDYFAGSPVLRANYEGLLRNVAVALGNWKSEEALDGIGVLLDHESPVVRAHAAWAAGEIHSPRASEILIGALKREAHHGVREKIQEVLMRA